MLPWFSRQTSGRRLPRWLRLVPNTTIVLFFLMMLLVWWMLDVREAEQRQVELVRDVQWAEQTIQLRLEDDVSQLATLVYAITHEEVKRADFERQAAELMANAPEIVQLTQFDAQGNWLAGAVLPEQFLPRLKGKEQTGLWPSLLLNARPVFSRPYKLSNQNWAFALLLPIQRQDRFAGAVMAVFDATAFVRHVPPAWFSEKYQLALQDQSGVTLARSAAPAQEYARSAARLILPGTGLVLRAHPLGSPFSSALTFQLALIGGLALLTLISLILLSRHIGRRIEAEDDRNMVYQMSQEMLGLMRADMTLLDVNPAFSAALGYSQAQLVGTSLLSYLQEEARESVREKLLRILDGTEPDILLETGLLAADGRVRWVCWVISPLRDRGLLYMSGRDLSHIRQVEAALRQESAYRKAMEDSLSAGVRAIDLEARILHVNPAFCRITGYSADELVGCIPPYPYWLAGDEGRRCHETLIQAMQGAYNEDGYEQVYRRKNGELFYGHLLMSPLIDEYGNHNGWMAALTDASEQQESRQRLMAAHERFVTVVEGLNVAVAVHDAASHELYFSNRLYAEQMAGNLVPDAPCCDVFLWRLIQTQGDFDFELQWGTEGGTRCLAVRRRIVRWVNGCDAEMILLDDITAQREAEQRYQSQLIQMQATSRLVTMGEMASTLAHELNQPLAAIANYQAGCVARIRQGKSSAEALLPVMQKITEQAERAGKVVRRVREFVKQSEPDRRPCLLADIIEATLSIADIEARRLGAVIELQLAADLPAVWVDPILIEQVLLNLIKNGIEAMQQLERPQRVLTITTHQLDARQIRLAIRDRGHGVPESIRGQLFDAFFTTKPDGMGMGLNICRSIIEMHQGQLRLDAAKEGGSVFSITLPVAESVCLSEA
ncbi:PAS domain S-box protein [Rhodobacteraceae bacterium CH30]|nr:PAS domain S-box protein [Rhodobacteraceae bacterium CH30]